MDRPTSIYLDLVRFLAAATVFVVHANYERFTGGLPLLWRLRDFGNDAVMVFFVLSGFVIAYVASEKEPTPGEYCASRLARLFSVAIPALLLTLLLDHFGARANPALYDGWWFQADNPAWRLFANAFFLNELWFNSVRPFSNGPYWSLGYEFWYYALFAAAYYASGLVRLALLGIICVVVGPKILLLFPIWLLGAGCFFFLRRHRLPTAAGWFLALGALGTYAVFHATGTPRLLLEWTIATLGKSFVEEQLAWSRYFLSSYIIGVLVAAHLIGMISVAPQLRVLLAAIERPVRYLAGFTFALYLFHYPCLQFFAAVLADIESEGWRAAGVVTASLAVVWILGSLTESRKSDVRRCLLVIGQGIATILDRGRPSGGR